MKDWGKKTTVAVKIKNPPKKSFHRRGSRSKVTIAVRSAGKIHLYYLLSLGALAGLVLYLMAFGAVNAISGALLTVLCIFVSLMRNHGLADLKKSSEVAVQTPPPELASGGKIGSGPAATIEPDSFGTLADSKLRDSALMQGSLSKSLTSTSRDARRFIESMPVGLITIDMDGRIRSANLRALIIFRTTIAKLKGLELVELVQLAGVDESPAPLTMERLTQTALGRLVEARARPLPENQAEVPVDLALGALDSDKDTGFIVSLTDVSHRYEVERLKEEFLSIVSHDLRTPLTSLGMFFNALLTSDEDAPNLTDEDRASAQSAQTSVNRMIRLVNSLLDVNMMRSGKLKLDLTDSEPDTAVSEVLLSLAQIAAEKNIELRSCSDGTPFLADHERIYQVLENMVGNAIKFSPSGTRISVNAAREGNFMLFEIIDQGPGVPFDVQKLFGRFEQASVDDQRGHKGFGLGLAICKLIVEAHGGSIGAENAPGCGSRFWFRIPLKELTKIGT